SGRRALPAAVRPARPHPALPRPGADLPERARRSLQGDGHPDGLHLRRRDRRRLVARKAARPPPGAGAGRAGRPRVVRAPGRGGAGERMRPGGRSRAYEPLRGKTVSAGREAVVAELRAAGALEGEPKPIEHAVRFYEKGDRPLEYISTRQWFVRLLDKKDALLARGEEITWHPDFMRLRY